MWVRSWMHRFKTRGAYHEREADCSSLSKEQSTGILSFFNYENPYAFVLVLSVSVSVSISVNKTALF